MKMGIGKGGGAGGKASPATQPLWPKPIPIIGVTGAYGSGKTLFGMTISPTPGTTLVYDFEKSSESYEDLGAHRVDAGAYMLDRHQGKAKPIDLFKWWRDHVRSIQPGKYRVIMVDPVSEIESGLVAYVEANPQEFGRTKRQYEVASGLKWGDVKELWKQVLSDVAARCETFVFVAHLKQVWAGNSPTGKVAPKGKTTLDELASLYLHMERVADKRTGQAPAVPSAVVRKQRLVHTRIDPETGELQITPALPPRLPLATPVAIRQYQLTPPDYAALDEEERAPEDAPPTEAELLEMRTRVAEAELATEQLRAERSTRAVPPKVADGVKAINKAVSANTSEDAAPPVEIDPDAEVTGEQLAVLSSLYGDVIEYRGEDDGRAMWRATLEKRGVASARELKAGPAAELISSMQYHLSLWQVEDGVGGADAAGLTPVDADVAGPGDPPATPVMVGN